MNWEGIVKTESAIGFIYLIEHLPTGKLYIGKKNLYTKSKQPSNWINYYSSCEWIKNQIKIDGKESFKRTILKYCRTAKELTYWENWYLYTNNVLTDEKYINNNISGKFFRRDLINK